jgi:uncharacterized membrane protein YhaH (DUF805 family)
MSATQFVETAPGSPSPQSFVTFLFSFSGRIPRYQYWIKFYLPYYALTIVMSVLDRVTGAYNAHYRIGLFSLIFLLAAMWPGLAVPVKRCHDRDRSGWFLLISLIPIIGWIWLAIELGFLRGTIGSNRFGADPVIIR